MEDISTIFNNINWATFRIPSIGFSDIIDMLVISYLMYKVLMWVKETRAWALLKGLAVVLLVYIISSVLELRSVSWLIVNSLNVGLIAILVLFQPEFRKLLEEIGKSKINTIFAVQNQENSTQQDTINEIIDAAISMSEANTGALIVIEKEIALDEIKNAGIQLDALCTSQLIISIFQDKTPLHDGAIIVKDNRIVAATCILPLSQKEMGHDLGTRHRAAVGVSEVSDAHVLVVSEETGEISIAKDGRLSKNLVREQIATMLSDDVSLQKKKLLVLKRRV